MLTHARVLISRLRCWKSPKHNLKHAFIKWLPDLLMYTLKKILNHSVMYVVFCLVISQYSHFDRIGRMQNNAAN